MNNENMTMVNALIARMNAHNDRCLKTMDLYEEEDCNEQCVDTMVRANIEVGIEYCCWMMEYGMDDARVDMVNGMVIPKSKCDIWATTPEGKPRYLSFEWIDNQEKA